MNQFQWNSIFTCMISLRKADSPVDRNRPSRKIILEIKPGRHERSKQANQMNNDKKTGNWRTVYAAVSPKFPQSFCVCLWEWLMAVVAAANRSQYLVRTGMGPVCLFARSGKHHEVEMSSWSLWKWPCVLGAFSSLAFQWSSFSRSFLPMCRELPRSQSWVCLCHQVRSHVGVLLQLCWF